PSAAVPSASAPAEAAPIEVPSAFANADAGGLRTVLIRAAHSRDWPNGEGALLALAVRDPRSFSREDVAQAGRDVVAGLEHDGHGDKAFDALANHVGDAGLDVLYDVMQAKGGSRAATRAGELLRQDAVRARESPALRIAFELRDASCED